MLLPQLLQFAAVACGVSSSLMQKIQSVQNATARLISGTRHSSPYTEVALASTDSVGKSKNIYWRRLWGRNAEGTD